MTAGNQLTRGKAYLGDVQLTANGAASRQIPKTVKVTLGVGTGGGGVLAWANPENATILVTSVVIDVTTQATGTPTIDVGVAANGTTSADTIIDGAAVGTAAVVLNNYEDQGTNGQSVVKQTSTQFITVSASADPAGLVGNAYITYVLV